ncbi:MAG: DUF4249 family protein [Saprospiraceae bacterium]
MKKYIILFPLISLFLLSCGEENLNNIAANQFVIEAFIYAGEPIADIRIKSTFPLSQEEDTSAPINDATVTLIKNGQRYALVSSGNEGLYNYPGDDVSVETNDVFQLEVVHNGITATAETMVPTPTMGLILSEDSLKVPQLPFSEGREAIVAAIGDFLRTSRIEATWNNPTEDLYFMVVESVSDTIDPIFPAQVIDALARFRFVSEPTDTESLTFLGGTLVSFGTYSVKVYHINQEYAALYENREQDSRDLNEPPSNVQNALGVFSAFNSQEAFFEVAKE